MASCCSRPDVPRDGGLLIISYQPISFTPTYKSTNKKKTPRNALPPIPTHARFLSLSCLPHVLILSTIRLGASTIILSAVSRIHTYTAVDNIGNSFGGINIIVSFGLEPTSSFEGVPALSTVSAHYISHLNNRFRHTMDF